MMRRREFITLLGGGGGVAARGARAAAGDAGDRLSQHAGSPDAPSTDARAFRKGLKETGYVEGQNVAIEYRWVERPMSIACRRWRPIWFADGSP